MTRVTFLTKFDHGLDKHGAYLRTFCCERQEDGIDSLCVSPREQGQVHNVAELAGCGEECARDKLSARGAERLIIKRHLHLGGICERRLEGDGHARGDSQEVCEEEEEEREIPPTLTHHLRAERDPGFLLSRSQELARVVVFPFPQPETSKKTLSKGSLRFYFPRHKQEG
jgi:hypothetical protein